MAEPVYVELHARSAFSFLAASSSPEQLAAEAARLGHSAMALCDRDGVYGAPRYFAAAREQGLRPIIGAELTLEDGSVLPVLVATRRGYRNLCRLITRAKLRAPKAESSVRWDELPEFAEGLIALTGDENGPLAQSRDWMGSTTSQTSSSETIARRLIDSFGQDQVFVELQRHFARGDNPRIQRLRAFADTWRLPVLATNGVVMATPRQRAAWDVLTCIRNHTHLDAAGRLLSQNAERCLKSPKAMAALFADIPDAIANTARLADRLEFTLSELGYEFPTYPVPEGETMTTELTGQAWAGARQRYGGEVSEKVQVQIRRELALIGKLGFAGYFLIVADLVRFCRDQGIMAQGRGSAANSTVCFCLGITAVDPLKFHTLFERFLSEGRKGWPDIDIDLPSGDRRERVIQEVYRRFGERGAAMTANVITFRGRSAAREIGKALNLAPDMIDRFSNLFASGDYPHTMDLPAQMEQAGLPAAHPRATAFADLYREIYGLPRHLGQHSGGMVICQGKLDQIVPLENASMPGRVVIQWDKDDCEDLGIIKVDLLGLGMMSLLQDAIQLTQERGRPVDLAQLPENDPATYALMQNAETIGVFQIESRAQMATLPRLKPKCFYDLVVEVAIIRPGPIQGGLTHPYLARRTGKEPVTYYHPSLVPVLERTLGVPLFQEQMLQIAMVLAGFTGDEAEELRRALSFHRSPERMERVGAKLRAAMEQRGIGGAVIDSIVSAISSFALYGFPESHAISFALLAYASAYLKVHRAPEFYASLLNNQPMGFYSPATIVKEAQRRGVRIRPVCIMQSDWRARIDADDSIRLGFNTVSGLRREHADSLVAERSRRAFASMADLRGRVSLPSDGWRTLAAIGACNALATHRRSALWHVERRPTEPDLFALAETPPPPSVPPAKVDSPLRPMEPGERLVADYDGAHLTLGPHPMAILRSGLPGIWRASDLPRGRSGQWVKIAGNVICRQRPGTAKGVVFVSLEDETGVSNAIVAPKLFERFRLVITQEPFLLIEGRLQTTDNVFVVRAEHVERLPHETLTGTSSHDFH